MEILLQYAWLVPCVFFTAILTAVSGAGGGVLLLGLMGAVLPPVAVVPVHGAVMMPQNIFRGFLLRKFVDWKFVGVVVVGSILGAFLIGPFVVKMPENLMRVVLGLGLLYLVWAPKTQHRLPNFPGKIILMAVLVSMVTMVIGAAGVLYKAMRRRQGLPNKQVLADQSFIMMVQHTLKMVVYGMYGFVFHPYIPLILCMAGMGLIGTFTGVCLMKKMGENHFDMIFQLVVSILAGKMLVDAWLAVF